MRKVMTTLGLAMLASMTACVGWAQQLSKQAPALTSAPRVQAAPQTAPADPQAKKGPQWKSRAEYDAFQAILKAGSPEAKVSAANAFLTKYPNSDFKSMATYVKFQSYLQLNNVSGAVKAAKEALQENPNQLVKVNTLHYLAFVFPYTFKPKDPDATTQLSQAQSEAKEGLQSIQQLQKPANVSETQFETEIKKFRGDFNRALGFIALEQKDPASAITYLKAAEQDNPKDSYTALFLGQAYLASKPPDYNNALWSLAHGVDLAKDQNSPSLAGLQKLYSQWYEYRHGSNAGEQKLIAQAESSGTPPAGFNVTTPPKHAKTGNPNVDAIYSIEDALSVGGDAAQASWSGYKGQPLGIVGYVDSVTPGTDRGTYDVKADVLPQDRGQSGTYQLELITDQADAKYLKLGDPIRFKGTISAYTLKPNFVLTCSNVEIDPATLRMASERAKAAAQKEAEKHKKRGR
jgi:tetratricopeptide (TPR) repeat protein